MEKINTHKIKSIIYNGLRNLDLSQLNKEELKKANEILEYLEICLSVKIQWHTNVQTVRKNLKVNLTMNVDVYLILGFVVINVMLLGTINIGESWKLNL